MQFLAAFFLDAFLATFLAGFFAAFFLATVTPPSRVFVELMPGKFHHRKLAAKLAWPMLYRSLEFLQERSEEYGLLEGQGRPFADHVLHGARQDDKLVPTL